MCIRDRPRDVKKSKDAFLCSQAALVMLQRPPPVTEILRPRISFFSTRHILRVLLNEAAAASPAAPPPIMQTSVSYTHLDVYKRHAHCE